VHLQQSDKRETFFGRVDMRPSTFFSLKKRLRPRGLILPQIKDRLKPMDEAVKNDALVQYIKGYLMEKGWKDANKQFENDIFSFLFQAYGSNRKRMETILKISYPNICLKMKDLNQNRHIMHLQE